MKYLKYFESINIKNIGRVVFTGSAGTGKSTLINMLRNEYTIVDEPATILITQFSKESPEKLPWNNRDIFQLEVENKCRKDWRENLNAIYDRSIVDEIGFRKFYKRDVPQNLIDDCKKLRYDEVFFFEPWEEIYKITDVRVEPFSTASKISTPIYQEYKNFGYNPIIVPKTSPELRRDFILNHI